MGNNHKLKAERLKGDPYIGVCFQALETLECLCLIQTRVNYWQTKAWILTSFWPKQSKGCELEQKKWVEGNDPCNSQAKQGDWEKISCSLSNLVQEVDPEKGHLICLTPKGSLQVILYKMIRFLSGKLKKHTKLAKIVKIVTDWSF